MIRGIFTIAFCLIGVEVWAQVAAVGDYRSKNSGLWAAFGLAGTWEVCTVAGNPGTWVDASAAPTNASGAIHIRNNHTVTVGTNINTDQTFVDLGGVLTANAIINVANGSGDDLTVTGTLNNNSTVRPMGAALPVFRIYGIVNNAGTLSNASRTNFENGSVYQHIGTPSIAGNIPPNSTWVTGSTCRIIGDIPDAPGNLNQSFSNFEWNTPVLSSGFVDFDGTLHTVRNNLSIIDTGGGIVAFTTGAGYTLTVGQLSPLVLGSFTMAVGTSVEFTVDNNAIINVIGNLSSAATDVVCSGGLGDVDINVTGNVDLTAGNFTVSDIFGTGIASLTVGGDYTNSGTTFQNLGLSPGANLAFNGTGDQTFTSTSTPSFAVNYSTSNTSNVIITPSSIFGGPGTLDVGSTSSLTLQSLDPSGTIQNGAAGGNIQVTGTRTYNGSVIYAGAAAQFMSSDHPGTANTVIDNSNGVSMLGDVTFTSGALTLTTGQLDIEAGNTLTLRTLSYGSGTLGVTPTSNIIINGPNNFGNLDLVLSGASMNNLTINRTGPFGRVTQVTPSLTVGGALSLLDGVFELGPGTTTTVSGNLAVGNISGSGSILGNASSNFILDGSGTMTSVSPDGVVFDGEVETLTMNRTGTFNFQTNDLVVNNLNLLQGTVARNGATALTMADGGMITRTNGSLTGTLAAAGHYDLLYGDFTAFNLNPGPELPNGPTYLNDFTINNTINVNRSVSTSWPIRAANDVNITSGTLVTGGNDIFLGGDFTVTANGILVAGNSLLTFNGITDQLMTTVPTLTINELVIDQVTTPSSLTLSGPVRITGRVNVNTDSEFDTGTNNLTLVSTTGNTAYVAGMTTSGSITGSVIVQRQLPNTLGIRAYRYIASPTSSSFVSDWQTEIPITGTFSNPSTGPGINSTTPSMFYYNEALVTGSTAQVTGYVPYPSSGNSSAAPLENGRGYSVFLRTTGVLTYDTRGTLGQHDVDIDVTHSGGTNGGYNLIGNPYPAPVFWDNVYPDCLGIDDAIYITDNTQNSGAANVAYVGGVATSGTYDGRIAQGQGFFVKVSSPGPGTVSFKETHKSSSQSQFIRQGEIPNVLRLAMKKDNVVDEIVVRVHEEASGAFDKRFDAYKFGATGLNISSLSQRNDRLAINSISGSGCDNNVPLFIDGGTNGNYSFDFTGLESFGSGSPIYLMDNVANKKIDITTTTHYDFSSTDAAKLQSRFELVFDGPTLEKELVLTGETTCESNGLAYVTLENSQADVTYSAVLNGTTVSEEIKGNGGALQIPVNVSLLKANDNVISVSAKLLACDAETLNNTATISVIRAAVISKVKDGTTCGDGVVKLNATGENAGQYNWYEDISDVTPIADAHANEFITPLLHKTKTYYVSAINSQGCEGERVAVKAVVANLDTPIISAEGTTLTSSYADGNQWYVDGMPISGATSQTIEATISGTYSVITSEGECTARSEGREMTVMGISETGNKFVTVYPNPTTDVVTIDVYSSEPVIRATLITSAGVQLNSIILSGSQDVKSGQFNLISLPEGIYMVRIQEGQKLLTKKISKIK